MFVEDDQPKKITIDMKRLRLRDFAKINTVGTDASDFGVIIPILARVCNLTEDEVWDWDFETMMVVQRQLNTAMDDVLKKTSGGS
jgi:hypothetical protein